MQTLIAWLPLLLCPLMMLICMGPMLRRGKKCGGASDVASLAPEQVRERLAVLQREELALREQLVSVELDGGTAAPVSDADGGAPVAGTP